MISNDFHVEGLCSRLFPNMFQLKNFVFVAWHLFQVFLATQNDEIFWTRVLRAINPKDTQRISEALSTHFHPKVERIYSNQQKWNSNEFPVWCRATYLLHEVCTRIYNEIQWSHGSVQTHLDTENRAKNLASLVSRGNSSFGKLLFRLMLWNSLTSHWHQ